MSVFVIPIVWAGVSLALIVAFVIHDAWTDGALALGPNDAVGIVVFWPLVIAALCIIAPFIAIHRLTREIKKKLNRR